MTTDLLELTQNYFTGSTVRQASVAFGERESNLAQALRSVLPLALSGLLTRAQQAGGDAELFRLAQRAHSTRLLGNLGELLNSLSMPSAWQGAPAAQGLAQWGAKMMRAALGSSYMPTVTSMSRPAGVHSATINNLLSLAVSVMLGLLGRHAAQNCLDSQGLSSYLGNQRGSLLHTAATLPGQLREVVVGLQAPVAAIAAVPAAAAVAAPALRAVPVLAPAVRASLPPLPVRTPGGGGWASVAEPAAPNSWPWLLSIGLVLTFLLIFMATCNKQLEPRRSAHPAEPSYHNGLDYDSPR